MIHRAVGIVISNDKGEILLKKRSRLKDTHPGKYTISTSGHVTKGQSYEAAAMRELQEEIGIQAKLTLEQKFLIETEIETEMWALFIGRHNGPFAIAKDEVDEVQFVRKDQISAMRDKLTPAAIQALEKFELL